MFLKKLLKISKVVLYVDFRHFAHWIIKKKYCENCKMRIFRLSFLIRNSIILVDVILERLVLTYGSVIYGIVLQSFSC